MISVAELDERIERCLTILADNPHSQVFAALSEAYRRRGEFGRAFSVCKSGLKHHPDYAPAHVVMAKLYFHQKMIDEALSSLNRAVEIDGQTRATDLLEAELYLESGDIGKAEAAISRLRRTQSKNPQIEELARHLLGLKSDLGSPDKELEESAQPSRSDDPPRVRDQSVTIAIDWTEWAAAIGKLRGVTGAAVFDPAGSTLASNAQEGVSHASMEAINTMFREVEGHLHQAEWGTLREVRVETDGRELWTGQHDDLVIGLVGNWRSSFGEIRRQVLDAAKQARSTDTSACADVPSDTASHTAGEGINMPPTAPAENVTRAGQGHTDGI